MTTTNNDGKDIVVMRWEKFDADILEKLSAMEHPMARLAAAKYLQSLTSTTSVDNFAASLAGILWTIERYGHKVLLWEPEEEDDNDGKDDNRTRHRCCLTHAKCWAKEEMWRRILAEDRMLPNSNSGLERWMYCSAKPCNFSFIPE